jgi:hypothetical protein
MAAEARRLFVPQYEPQAWAPYPGDGDERVLDDEEVLRLLSGAGGPVQSDQSREPVDAGEARYAGDALAPARAIAIGAALASPFWIIAAVLLI